MNDFPCQEYQPPQPLSLGRRRLLSAACGLGPLWAVTAHRQTEGRRHQGLLATEDRVALALGRFQAGFHCSQCVLEAYAADFGLDPELALLMSAALAGGSGVGGECGAVASGYLVLGMKYATTMPSHGDVEREPRLWSRVDRFLSEFRRLHGSITCRELLGVDVFTRAGREVAMDKDLFAQRCAKHIRHAIEIIDSLG